MVANGRDKKLSSPSSRAGSSSASPPVPFPAIVGQPELKRVLLAVAANDDLDGALVVGEKGTAKSTAVRGLVELLPTQRAVADCPYGCAPNEPALQCSDCRERAREELPVETRPVPLVTLPLGATRDRVVGTLSVEDALAGAADFDPGLLARAHRGFLYVDEVNLLDDHLADVLLDAAASGVNTVERDGMSVSHPAEFTLIGTMNPEEGDLRPQLRDRFALQATVEGCREIADRVEIIDQALAAGTGSDSVTGSESAAEVETLREELAAARDRLSAVSLPTEFKETIAELCLDAGVDGHRGDVATARTATTLAALEGRTTVIESDVREAATYSLPHRLRSTPFEDEPELEDVLEDRFDGDADEEREGDEDGNGDGDGDGTGDETEGTESETGDDGNGETDGEFGSEHDGDRDSGARGDDGDGERETGSGAPGEFDGDADGDGGAERRRDGDSEGEGDGTAERAASGGPSPDSSGTEASGRSDRGDGDDGSEGERTRTEDGDSEESDAAQPLVPGQERGGTAAIGEATAPELESPAAPDGSDGDSTEAGGPRSQTTPHADNRGARVRTEPASTGDSIDAAASVRAAAARGSSQVAADDLRQSVRAGERSVTIVFAVDASASMRPAMRTAKGVVLELLRDSYQQRDRVAFVAFAGEDADVLLPPTDSVSLAARHLKELPSGDRTPLPSGLRTARQVLERAESDAAVVVLVTDGRANVADGSPTAATRQAARELGGGETGASVLVVDAGDDSRAGLSELVARETGGELVELDELSVGTVRTAADRAVPDGV